MGVNKEKKREWIITSKRRTSLLIRNKISSTYRSKQTKIFLMKKDLTKFIFLFWQVISINHWISKKLITFHDSTINMLVSEFNFSSYKSVDKSEFFLYDILYVFRDVFV